MCQAILFICGAYDQSEQRHAFVPNLFQCSFGPEGGLDFPDVGFAQKEHADSGLADSAADGKGEGIV